MIISTTKKIKVGSVIGNIIEPPKLGGWGSEHPSTHS